MRIEVNNDGEVFTTTFAEFRVDNLEGIGPEQLDGIEAELQREGQCDISAMMHCGSRCVLKALSENGPDPQFRDGAFALPLGFFPDKPCEVPLWGGGTFIHDPERPDRLKGLL